MGNRPTRRELAERYKANKPQQPKPKPEQTTSLPNGSTVIRPTNGGRSELPVDVGNTPLWMMGGLDEAPRWRLNKPNRTTRWAAEQADDCDFEDDYNGQSYP